MPASVLLVHDDIAAIAAARRVLVAEGLDVTLATSSSDAFISYQQRPFQLVVLAPAVDSGRGASVYDEIRSLPSGARVRFILLGSEIAEARGALVVDLPVQAAPFRMAVREALEGLGDTTLAPRHVRGPEAEHPTFDASPWGAPAGAAPLAQQLFDDRREAEVPTAEDAAGPMLIMPAVTMGETEALPEPYAAITPEAPTLERELRWDELNLPSEDSDEARRPLTLSDARPVTAPTPARKTVSESRILAELTAESEIVSRARALTDPTHAMKSVRPETDPNTTSLLESERQARTVTETKLAEAVQAEAQRRTELEQAEARHRAELSHAVAQLRAEAEESEARHRAELEQLSAQRADAEARATAERAAWEQSQAESLGQLEVAQRALAESEQRLHDLARAAESQTTAEVQQRAEAEARAHSTAERLSNLEQRAAQAQVELEAEREARQRADEGVQSEVSRRSLIEQELAEARAELENERQAREAAEQRALSLDEQRAQLEEASRAALADAGAEAEHLAAAVLEHQAAEARHAEAAGAHSAAKQRADELATRREELERATHAAQERAQSESQQVIELEAAQQRAQQELEALRQARADAERLTHEASARRTTLEHELRRTRDHAAEEQSHLTELQRLHAEAEAQLVAEGAARAEAEQLTQSELAQIEEAERALTEAQSRFTAAQEARGEVEQRARAAQERRRQLQEEAQSARERAQAGETRLAEFEKARLRIEGHLQTAIEQRDQAATQLQALTTQDRDEAARLAELERQQHEAEQALLAQREALAAGEHHVQEVRAQREAAEQARSELHTQAQQAEHAIGDLQAQTQEAEHAIAELQVQAQQAADRLVELQRARSEAERVREETQRSREAAEQHLAGLSSQREEQRQHAEQTEQRAQLEAQRLAELEEQRRQAESQLAEAQRQREEAVARAESGTTLVAEAERAHADAQARLQAELSGRAEAERKAEEVAARRAAFAEALAKADPHADPPSPPSSPEEAPAPPPVARRVLRPLAGGRWKRAELGPLVPLPAEAALPAVSEGPSEARPPRFVATGRLAELGAAELLARCWHERVTGRFDFDCRDGARALFFEEGRVVAALSNAPTDRLEALAQRDGLITRAHQRALRPDAERLSARQLAVRLVELRLIKGTELYTLVRRQMEEVAFALFSDDSAEYLYAPDLAPQELRVALPVTPLAFMVEGVRRKGDFDRLNAALGGPTVRVRLLKEGAPDLADLGLSARERRLVSLVDGLRTVEELIFASGLDPQAAVKLLYALRAAGAIETLASEPAEVAEGGRAELLIDLGRVTEKYHQVQQGDYFEILGVQPEATAYEVRQAFERLTREFHPARFAGVSDEALPAHLEEIGRMVAEAADVLGDDLTRREYARNLSVAT